MKKMIVIVGPTASGKTALGITAAQKFSGSLINADSRQVYKNLDIISGKDIPLGSSFTSVPVLSNTLYTIGFYQIENIPQYLVDIVNPEYEFSINDFVKIAPPTIEYVTQQNSLPMVVGGTGFYIKGLLDGVETVSIEPDRVLRKSLENKTVNELQKKLQELNSERFSQMNNSDKNNPRRLVRAIEIEARPLKKNREMNLIEVRPLSNAYEILMIGLTASRKTIQLRIDQRVMSRLKLGALKEAESLFKKYDSLSNNVKTSSGYQQLFQYFKGEVDLEGAVEKWKQAEYLIAKKQMTWFKKDKRIIWFDIEQKGYENKIFAYMNSFLASK